MYSYRTCLLYLQLIYLETNSHLLRVVMVTRSPLSPRQRARASSQEKITSYTLIQVFMAASKSYPRTHPKY